MAPSGRATGRAIRHVGCPATGSRRDGVFGRRIEIAGTNQTGASLRPQDEDLAAIFEWLDRVGYAVDRPALAREFPEVAWQDFAIWAAQQDWSRLLQAA